MKFCRKRAVPLSLFLAFFMLQLSVPYQPVMAAMISTDTCLDFTEVGQERDQIRQFLAQDVVRKAFISHGVMPEEVEARLAGLSDAEILEISKEIENLPAGGDGVGLVIAVLLIVILVIVIMRLL